MAEGGAWQSDVFDNGRDFHHGDKAATPVPGVPASMYNPSMSMRSGQDSALMPIISIALRCVTMLFSTIAFAITASNTGSDNCGDYYLSCTNYWRALNSSNLAYLLAIDVIVCFYSIVQMVLSIVSACTGSPVLKGPRSPAATITFICDQVLTYMLMAGCGAGAAVSMSFKTGDTGDQCSDGLSVFCDKNAASVSMSFIAFLGIALSTAMAYFRIYKMA